MKKRVLCILMTGLLIFAAAGCGNQAAPAPEPAPADVPEEPADAPAEEEPELVLPEPESETELVLPLPGDAVPSDAPVVMMNNKSYYEYNEAGDVLLFSGTFQGITLAEESKDAYPELAQELQATWIKEQETADESAYQNRLDAENQYNEMKESGEDMEFFRNYSDDRKVQVTRCDGKILSICQSLFSDYGGAHGTYGNVGETYRTEDGKKLSLSDVIRDKDAFAELLVSKIETEYPEVFEDSIDVEDTKNTIRGDVNNDAETWILDPEGIQFFFNPYEIAPYALGEQVVKVTVKEAPELFVEEYLPDPALATITGTPNRTDFQTDLDGDGVMDKFRIAEAWSTYGEDSEEYYVSGLQVFVGDDDGIQLFESDEIFDYEGYLARFPSGKAYLLIDTQEMNDYHGLHIIDLNNKAFTELENSWLAPEYRGYDEDTETNWSCLMTDPANLRLTKHFDRFSTFQAGGRFVLDENGNLSGADPYAIIPESSREYYVLKSVVDLTLDIVNEEGEVTEPGATIPSGTTFTLYRTPFEETDPVYADAILPDGRLARLAYDSGSPENGSRMINGMEESEAFESLFYAG